MLLSAIRNFGLSLVLVVVTYLLLERIRVDGDHADMDLPRQDDLPSRPRKGAGDDPLELYNFVHSSCDPPKPTPQQPAAESPYDAYNANMFKSYNDF